MKEKRTMGRILLKKVEMERAIKVRNERGKRDDKR